MGWLSDALDFEAFNLKEVWNTIKDDPERLFLGALTPAGTELWGGLLGKDWESPTNWFGGPSDATFEKAQAKGIDTGSAQGIHDVAQSIAAMYAGGYGMDQLGSAGNYIEKGTQIAGNFQGGGSGMGQPQQPVSLLGFEGEAERRRREEEQRQAMLAEAQRQMEQRQLQGLLANAVPPASGGLLGGFNG